MSTEEVVEVIVVLTTLACELRCRVDLAELYELVVLVTASDRDERALVLDVLRTRTIVIALVAHEAHDAKTACAAGETANKRGCALVLAAAYFYSCCFIGHSRQTIA